jgi:alkanesulfonate monooxygenase SsuD/methylene tetrahydromethanopterin reductase-like flavin-dependent oxidoreductase (luciferase family)
MPIEAALARLSAGLGIDFDDWNLDAPLRHQKVEGVQGMMDMFTTMLPGREITLREAATVYGFSIGMPVIVGSPLDIADELEELFTAGHGDGFNISVPATPHDYEQFVDGVVPILQERGLFRTEYDGTTFRDRLIGRVSARA